MCMCMCMTICVCVCVRPRTRPLWPGECCSHPAPRASAFPLLPPHSFPFTQVCVVTRLYTLPPALHYPHPRMDAWTAKTEAI